MFVGIFEYSFVGKGGLGGAEGRGAWLQEFVDSEIKNQIMSFMIGPPFTNKNIFLILKHNTQNKIFRQSDTKR